MEKMQSRDFRKIRKAARRLIRSFSSFVLLPVLLSVHDICLVLGCFFFTSSWACFGHYELWRHQGQACPHHVVSARPVAEKEWSWQHLHQELGQVYWQQGPVRHLLCFWQHPVLQGKAVWGPFKLTRLVDSVHDCLCMTLICICSPVSSLQGGLWWEWLERLRLCALWDSRGRRKSHWENERHVAQWQKSVSELLVHGLNWPVICPEMVLHCSALLRVLSN